MNQPQAPTKPAPAPPTHQHPHTPAPVRPAGTERAIAWATTLAPVATGLAAPLMADSAALAASTLYTAGLAGASLTYMQRIPTHVLDQLPAGDILHAHRSPLLQSTLASGMALAMGTLQGPAGTDALLAGFLTLPSVPGIVSLGWWGVTALIPWRLRSVLTGHRSRRTRKTPTAGQPGARAPMVPLTDADQILHRWGTHISHPDKGTHRGQVLTLHTFTPQHWTGRITALPGQNITVTAKTVSSVYEKPASWITITPGPHEGIANITVNLIKPAELDTTTLKGAWAKWVARSGGVMAGTYLEDVQDDPHTGGEVAYVIAGENIDELPSPNRRSLAGALRINTLLCSYSHTPGDPRRGEIRLMKHNPLQDGITFPGTDVLKISEGGYVHIGRHVSGFPARIQFTDPVLGARHLFIAGVTGSGKGGLVQIVALADHVNGHAIIYGDPKGSSNPDVETMAAYSGLGEEGVMGALRVAYALLQWRIAESARLKMKNFISTPDRPWVRVILDEAHVPLSELEQHRKEAGVILEALAAKARSLGIILTVVNQAVNADKLGGSTALRMNVIQGGSLVMLRSDSGQQHLATTGFEGVDPGEIPAAWDVERPLIYDEKVAMKDPKATYGLGYTLGPGGGAEMMRTFNLESAAPYVDPSRIAYPADWPDWENRHEIAAQPIQSGDDDGDTGFGSFLAPAPAAAKPANAQDKILAVLRDAADPAGIDINYVHRTQIGQLAGLNRSTLDNALSGLSDVNLIHRDPARRGWYAEGPRPEQPLTEAEED
ncbi:type IV secretory system conjugative DNA transfer family protein [Streptomyces sp. NPDC060243]|uniref:type IV secretory system conjugative DNA transfer family protein n=1 Tax=Streptomyces sp. NPDC060243 TaxID=3347081 RepID=UPI003652E57A